MNFLLQIFLLAFLFAWQNVTALNGDTSALVVTKNALAFKKDEDRALQRFYRYINHDSLLLYRRAASDINVTTILPCESAPSFVYGIAQSELIRKLPVCPCQVDSVLVNTAIEQWNNADKTGLGLFLEQKLCNADKYSLLRANARYKILRILSEGAILSGNESQVITTLSKTPPQQASSLLSLLSNDHTGVLQKLDAGIQLTNYDWYYIELLRIFMLGADPSALNTEIQGIKTLLAAKGEPPYRLAELPALKTVLWLNEGLYDRLTLSDFRNLYIQDKDGGEGVSINNSGEISFVLRCNAGLLEQEPAEYNNLKPFSLIRVSLASDEPLLNNAKVGDEVYVPAIMLPYIVDRKFNREYYSSVSFAFIIGAAYFSGGTIGVTLLNDFDIVFNSCYLYIDSKHAELETSPEGREFLGCYERVSRAYFLLSAGKIGFGVFKNSVNLMKSSWTKFKTSNFFANYKTLNPTNATKLESEVKGVIEEADKLDGVVVSGAGRHPNWVEVLDVKNKVLAKKTHVLRMDINANNTGFKGCHSKIALDDYIINNPTATYEFRNKLLDVSGNGVYEANPVIKLQNGTELVKTNNAGKSTFFPDAWNEVQILDEVEYAISNNHGLHPTGAPNEYFGFSRDGKVEIHFYLSADGSVNSYFPKKN